MGIKSRLLATGLTMTVSLYGLGYAMAYGSTRSSLKGGQRIEHLEQRKAMSHGLDRFLNFIFRPAIESAYQDHKWEQEHKQFELRGML